MSVTAQPGSVQAGPIPRRTPIPRIQCSTREELLERWGIPGALRTPVILVGMTKRWKAIGKWTPRRFRERFEEQTYRAFVDLRDDGVPHRWLAADHARMMTMRDFVDLMERSPKPCYLSQIPLGQFPKLADEIDFRAVAPPDQHETYTALWIGSGNTNSGLHFDKLDNYFVQAYGRKIALLASPDQTRFIYPYRYNFAKSRVDPERPNLEDFPGLREVTLMEAVLEPGEMLFIPKLWWHYLRSLEPSISINYFFGQYAALGDLVGVLNAGGVGHWLTFFRDFLWYGVLGRPFQTRLLSEQPTGKQAWALLKDALSRRGLGGRRTTY